MNLELRHSCSLLTPKVQKWAWRAVRVNLSSQHFVPMIIVMRITKILFMTSTIARTTPATELSSMMLLKDFTRISRFSLLFILFPRWILITDTGTEINAIVIRCVYMEQQNCNEETYIISHRIYFRNLHA